MTVIAYKDGVVACDSWVTQGDTVVDRNCNKSKKVNGIWFWLCGDVDSEDTLVEWFFDDSAEFEEDADVGALAWDGKDLWRLGRAPNSPAWKIKLSRSESSSLGSGSHFALGAMDAGASAAEAAKIACDRSVHCGGRIRVKKLW